MSEIRIADRFEVRATLEEGKLGILYLVDDGGAPALLLVLDEALDVPDSALEAILADNRAMAASADALLTTAWGKSA